MTDFKHPSYGMVQISRRSGSPKLFGSSLSQTLTQNYITISVRKATLIREGTDPDRYYGSMRGDLIEVDLSAAQFAELITTMNVGLGVPCTVSVLNNEKVAPPPDLSSESENIREKFKAEVTEFAREVQDDILPKVREILTKKTLNMADRQAVISAFERVARETGSNVPYTLELFEEATEKVVAAAKTEIDAVLTSVIMNAGLASLQANPEALGQLGAKKAE